MEIVMTSPTEMVMIMGAAIATVAVIIGWFCAWVASGDQW